MNKKILVFIFLILGATLFLLPNFYRNKWIVVEPAYYDEWQVHYDRTVIARLVKNRQDGFFSAGGLLGLGNVSEWSYANKVNLEQYDKYVSGGTFSTYLPYKSHPGFQGFIFGLIDQIEVIPKNQAIKIFRGLTALASTIMVAIIIVGVGVEVGWFSSLLVLFFSAFCPWMILPAGSIYWNLWAFFLPFVTSAFVLAFFTKTNKFEMRLFQKMLFITMLVKVLFTGFEIITTILVMTTVPIVFYGIYKEWERRKFLKHFINAWITIVLATITGLFILSAQIIASDKTPGSAVGYILNRFGHHFGGNSEIYVNPDIEPTKIGALEITSKYLNVSALTINFRGISVEILYWHLVLLFAVFTIIYLIQNRTNSERKAKALIISTWYSILAPFSWFLIFRPHSIIHTHVNSIGWQMPFTLLGFALCGYVISNFTKKIPYTIER